MYSYILIVRTIHSYTIHLFYFLFVGIRITSIKIKTAQLLTVRFDITLLIKSLLGLVHFWILTDIANFSSYLLLGSVGIYFTDRICILDNCVCSSAKRNSFFQRIISSRHSSRTASQDFTKVFGGNRLCICYSVNFINNVLCLISKQTKALPMSKSDTKTRC